MRCKTCHYSLRGLIVAARRTEHRCPECGSAFNPRDPSTYDDPDRFDPSRESTRFTASVVLRPIVWIVGPFIATLLMVVGFQMFTAGERDMVHAIVVAASVSVVAYLLLLICTFLKPPER